MCAAVCYRVLQCVLQCVLQYVAVCCSVLRVAVCCSVAVSRGVHKDHFPSFSIASSCALTGKKRLLQYVSVHCSGLQCAAIRWKVCESICIRCILLRLLCLQARHVCCTVLQCCAVCVVNTSVCIALSCIVFQCIVVWCSVVQCGAVRCSMYLKHLQLLGIAGAFALTGKSFASIRPATPCNTLQHTATPCNTLQHTATGKRHGVD